MWIHTHSTLWMIGGFVFIIYMGHLYICAMVVVIQILMSKELFNLLRKVREDRDLPGFRLLNWIEMAIIFRRRRSRSSSPHRRKSRSPVRRRKSRFPTTRHYRTKKSRSSSRSSPSKSRSPTVASAERKEAKKKQKKEEEKKR
ncbi:hypothetical protein BVRB_7g165300 [Beta vulgaris subsp. vulgaris]|nr:hypothetical protein BVRB_7g165300 [Beta vulgaris subsp. vulgaris]